MKSLLKILLFLSVLNGFFARGNFIFEYDIKSGFRIAMFVLMFACLLLMYKSLKIKYIDIIVITNLLLLSVIQYREELITGIFIILFVKLYEKYEQYEFEQTLNKANWVSICMIFIFLKLGLTLPEVWIHSGSGSFVTNNFEDMFRDFGDARVRYTFGMNHPNSFVGFIVSLITFTFLRLSSKWSFILNMVFVVITVYFTDTKSILIYFLSLYVFMFLFRRLKLSKIIYMPIFLTILTFILTFYFNNSSLNEALSDRLNLWYEYINSMTGKELIFGKDLTGYIVDNSYIQLFFGAGIVFFMIFCIKTIKAIRLNLYNKNILITSFVVSYLIYNFVEAYLLRFENAATILFWYYIFKDDIRPYKKSNNKLKHFKS
ncbi:hypothetical protein KM925_13615 [Priestia megaterium]|uniref:hypothetical protein n=1 Tax=Priestia megaterium TaxID=1404 RepID=UPI001C21B641|nr:hypothetical protein [Priestia megaterium]MBU8586944.1 hypothetical protein [Priestia megaterium]